MMGNPYWYNIGYSVAAFCFLLAAFMSKARPAWDENTPRFDWNALGFVAFTGATLILLN